MAVVLRPLQILTQVQWFVLSLPVLCLSVFIFSQTEEMGAERKNHFRIWNALTKLRAIVSSVRVGYSTFGIKGGWNWSIRVKTSTRSHWCLEAEFGKDSALTGRQWWNGQNESESTKAQIEANGSEEINSNARKQLIDSSLQCNWRWLRLKICWSLGMDSMSFDQVFICQSCLRACGTTH